MNPSPIEARSGTIETEPTNFPTTSSPHDVESPRRRVSHHDLDQSTTSITIRVGRIGRRTARRIGRRTARRIGRRARVSLPLNHIYIPFIVYIRTNKSFYVVRTWSESND